MYQDSSKPIEKRTVEVSVSKDGIKRPLKALLIAAVTALVFIAVARTFAQAFTQNLAGGDTLSVLCDGSHLEINTESRTSVNMLCAPNDGEPTPDPEPTDEPTPEPTSEPNPTPDPQPTDEPEPPTVSADYGEFPNGKNGGVCAESHAWWLENGEGFPRHAHSAACVPAARGANGQDGPTVNNFNVSSRSLSFNSPGELNWHRAQWKGDTQQVHDIGETCQNGINEYKECIKWVEYDLNANSGMDELRLATDMRHSDLGTRQYSVINFQVRGSDGGNYRGGPWIIGRHWYTGFGYVRVYLLDYMELVKPGESMPTVSGTFTLDVKHDGDGCREGQMYLNPDFHAIHAAGMPDPAPNEQTGCGTHTYSIDTTQLENGRNTLYFQTMAEDSRGELASAVLVFIDVQN